MKKKIITYSFFGLHNHNLGPSLWCFFIWTSPDILALCDINLQEPTNSSSFYVRGYLPLVQKDSFNHMHGLTVYVKEVLSFAY